jgi:hypothetical protein
MEEGLDLDFPKTAEKAAGPGKKPRKAVKAAKNKATRKKPATKALAKKKSGPKSPSKSGLKKGSQPAAAKKRPRMTVVKPTVKKKSAELSDGARVLKIINRSKNGIDVATLVQKTAFDEKKIRNIIYRAYKDGVIKRAGRGIYLGAGKRKARK